MVPEAPDPFNLSDRQGACHRNSHMTTITTIAREPKADAVTLHCETRVEKRDRKADFGRGAVPGLMIDRTAAGTLF
jgi:hypothetical protein